MESSLSHSHAFIGCHFLNLQVLMMLPTNARLFSRTGFDYLKSKGHDINVIPIAIGIMPNHLHALIALKNSDQSINTVVSNAKRFMAYETLVPSGQNKITDIQMKL